MYVYWNIFYMRYNRRKMDENGKQSVAKFQWNVWLFRPPRMGGCIGITRARTASVDDTSANSTRTHSGKNLNYYYDQLFNLKYNKYSQFLLHV